MKTPRSIAVDILNRVEEKDAFAELLLDEALSDNVLSNIHDRRLLTQIVYGTLRMRGRLDWIIAQLYRGRIADLDTDVKNILRISLYQLLFTQRIPQFAICDEAVKITKKLNSKASGLVNAILRNAIRKREEIVYPDMDEDPCLYVSTVYSHPLWLVESWIAIFGMDETIGMCKANNEIPPAAVRVNRMKAAREDVMEALNQQGYDARPAPFSLDGLILTNQPASIRETASYKKGHLQMQDEASQMIARLVDPQPADTILDLCAGTGGKTNHLAEMMNNDGCITAVDLSGQKLELLQINAKRLGVSIVQTLPGDAAGKLNIAPDRKFDKILIDAPCSGLGTLRRNPEIKWRLRPQDIKKCASLQNRILNNALHYLKKGGVLVYSTCTNLPAENEDIVADFLHKQGNFRILPPPKTIRRELVDDQGFFKTKTHYHGTDGFFGAIIRWIS